MYLSKSPFKNFLRECDIELEFSFWSSIDDPLFQIHCHLVCFYWVEMQRTASPFWFVNNWIMWPIYRTCKFSRYKLFEDYRVELGTFRIFLLFSFFIFFLHLSDSMLEVCHSYAICDTWKISISFSILLVTFYLFDNILWSYNFVETVIIYTRLLNINRRYWLFSEETFFFGMSILSMKCNLKNVNCQEFIEN